VTYLCATVLIPVLIGFWTFRMFPKPVVFSYEITWLFWLDDCDWPVICEGLLPMNHYRYYYDILSNFYTSFYCADHYYQLSPHFSLAKTSLLREKRDPESLLSKILLQLIVQFFCVGWLLHFNVISLFIEKYELTIPHDYWKYLSLKYLLVWYLIVLDFP
jgi:hypothetical protein